MFFDLLIGLVWFRISIILGYSMLNTSLYTYIKYTILTFCW